MRFSRVAVQGGADIVRVAAVEAGGEPRILAEVRAGQVDDVLREVVGPPPDELVLVHPTPPGAGLLARRVLTLAAPVAAAGTAGVHAVLDVGRTGARASLVRDGVVTVHRVCGVGGDRLDDVVLELLACRHPGLDAGARAEARRVRETLSLQSGAVARLPDGEARLGAGEVREALTPVLGAVVGLLREVLAAAGRPVRVLLVGGVARTPLLAELVDAAGIEAAVVAPRPEAAAVLGALAVPWTSAAPDGGAPRSPQVRWLPGLPPARHGRTVLVSLGAAAAVAGLVGAGQLIAPRTAAVAGGVPSGVLVQYGYRLDLPPGWEHTGGMPERRRVLLTPAVAPEGSDLVAVERTALGYDSGAEPGRARAELRAEFDAAVADGAPLSEFATARVDGRQVTTYRQREGDTVVEWSVVLDGDAQLSVGCRHTSAGQEAVRAACAVVVASVRRA